MKMRLLIEHWTNNRQGQVAVFGSDPSQTPTWSFVESYPNHSQSTIRKTDQLSILSIFRSSRYGIA